MQCYGLGVMGLEVMQRSLIHLYVQGCRGLLSVNQLAAEIKLIEVWKSINVDRCPTKMEPYSTLANQPEFRLRPKTTKIFLDTARLLTMFKALLPMFKQLAIFFKNSSPKIDVG